jgi:3-oxoacyl-[acyl-carrier protein] reductase
VLADKTVLITGANRGIGRATAESFAKAGANLIAHARVISDGFTNDMADLAGRYGIQVNCISFDMTDTSAMKAALNTELPLGRRIDVLVNNAGTAHGGLFQMTPLSVVRSVFDINFFGQLELMQIILRKMIRQKSGAIVNIGSIAGIDLAAGNVAYGASKAALMACTKTIAAETGTLGVRINAVAPGLTDTQMAKKMDPKAWESMIEGSAMKRLASVEEIAKVILFLASDDASFINGQVISVNGGTV